MVYVNFVHGEKRLFRASTAREEHLCGKDAKYYIHDTGFKFPYIAPEKTAAQMTISIIIFLVVGVIIRQ